MGWIYFAQIIGPGEPVKIGFTDSHPSNRIRVLETSSPYEIRVLGAMVGTAKDERALHRKFKSERIRGEWFRCSPRLVSFIAKWGWCYREKEKAEKRRADCGNDRGGEPGKAACGIIQEEMHPCGDDSCRNIGVPDAIDFVTKDANRAMRAAWRKDNRARRWQ